eukprot:gene19615-20064_t
MKHLTEQFREHADATRDRLDRIDEHLEASDRRFEVLRTASEVDVAVKGLMMRAGAIVMGIGSAVVTFLTINFPAILAMMRGDDLDPDAEFAWRVATHLNAVAEAQGRDPFTLAVAALIALDPAGMRRESRFPLLDVRICKKSRHFGTRPGFGWGGFRRFWGA